MKFWVLVIAMFLLVLENGFDVLDGSCAHTFDHVTGFGRSRWDGCLINFIQMYSHPNGKDIRIYYRLLIFVQLDHPVRVCES